MKTGQVAKVKSEPSVDDLINASRDQGRPVMSPERTHAYRRVLQTLADLGPSKLQSGEQERIRYAADSLIFCQEVESDPAAVESLAEVRLLLDHLVDSGRWTKETADHLSDDILACGPREELALGAAA
jgi:hypothetical protein